MTRFIVEGRRFDKHLHAVTFAKRIAEEMDRAVEIHADQVSQVERCERSWLATMHPRGVPARVTIEGRGEEIIRGEEHLQVAG